MTYWEKRNAAIRKFYGNVPEAEYKLYECNLWYSPTQDKCFPEEPSEAQDDGYTTAISKATARTAMYGPQPEI